MKNFVLLLTLCCMYISCRERQTKIDGFPVKICQGDTCFGLLTLEGKVLTDTFFLHKPSLTINRICVLPCGEDQFRMCDVSALPMTCDSRRFRRVGNFVENVTVAQEKKDGPFILIDRSGECVAVIDSYRGDRIRMMHNFSDGLALVYTENRKYGYVNTCGEWIVAPMYDFACDFSEGVALVGSADAQGRLAYLVIDRKGNERFHVSLTNCQLQGRFSNGWLVYRDLRQRYCACLDKKGKTVLYLPDEVQDMTEYRYDRALALAQTGIGVLNKKGKWIIPADFDDGKFINSNYLAMKRTGKWALFDLAGVQVTPFVYEKIMPWEHTDLFFVRQDGSDFLIDAKRREVNTDTSFELDWEIAETASDIQVFYRYPFSKVCSDSELKTLPEYETPISQKVEQRGVDTTSPFYQETQKILKGGYSENDSKKRRVILNYMEHFRMSYVTKDIDFLEQLFSEKALIIVGTVVKQLEEDDHHLSPDRIRYNIKNKRQYLDRLRQIFKANKEIDVRFSDFLIRRHPTRPEIYGVSVRQTYVSDLYSDEGYLFLLWDFSDKIAPKIHVRTWQPRRLDDHSLLPERDIIHLGSFDFE